MSIRIVRQSLSKVTREVLLPRVNRSPFTLVMSLRNVQRYLSIIAELKSQSRLDSNRFL